MGSNNIYSGIFFDVNNSRETPTSNDATVQDSTLTTGGAWFSSKATPTAGIVSSTAPKSSIISSVSTPSLKLGGPVAEDKRMSMQAFNSLIQQMVPLSGNLCPQNGKMTNPFNNQIMPDLSCPGSKFGGKRKTKKSFQYRSG
jgi:hypothetical protein